VTRARALVLAAGFCAVATPRSTARACAEMFNARVSESDRRPSLAYEQTLIVYDAEKHREHFVREVVFQESREPFGFVVPTPTRPEVAKVKKSPFAKLRETFPFEWVNPERLVRLASSDMEDASVKVIEVTRVGRFTAFVLAASDAAGLKNWLAQNGFVTTPETEAWLAHYVKLGFFYVAMRYEPSPGDKGNKTKAETVRISFDSPLPYYPYLEPDPRGGKPPASPRLLDIWLVSTRDFVPVAPRSGEKADRVRPFLEGSRYKAKSIRTKLAAAVEPALLPEGQLRLQRFADQKRSRIGFGDVDFVPDDADAGGTPASKLPVVATEAGRRFDPDLRDRVAPVRRIERPITGFLPLQGLQRPRPDRLERPAETRRAPEAPAF
jgi:hypothetical protein